MFVAIYRLSLCMFMKWFFSFIKNIICCTHTNCILYFCSRYIFCYCIVQEVIYFYVFHFFKIFTLPLIHWLLLTYQLHLYFYSFEPACSAHSACFGISGDCCPTTSGELLKCCGKLWNSIKKLIWSSCILFYWYSLTYNLYIFPSSIDILSRVSVYK